MPKHKKTNQEIEKLVGEVAKTYEGDSGINFIDVTNLPVREKILEILSGNIGYAFYLFFIPKELSIVQRWNGISLANYR